MFRTFVWYRALHIQQRCFAVSGARDRCLQTRKNTLKVINTSSGSYPFHRRFIFSDAYLKAVGSDLAVNIYCAVANPLGAEGMVRIVKGALRSRDLRKDLLSMDLPLILVQVRNHYKHFPLCGRGLGVSRTVMAKSVVCPLYRIRRYQKHSGKPFAFVPSTECKEPRVCTVITAQFKYACIITPYINCLCLVLYTTSEPSTSRSPLGTSKHSKDNLFWGSVILV